MSKKNKITQKQQDDNKFLDQLIEENKKYNNDEINEFKVIKNFFEPAYSVLNYSNNTKKEILKISNKCKHNNKIIVFIKRTSINDTYFKQIELCENSKHKTEKINSIFLNLDNYYFFTSTGNYVKNDGRLYFVRKAIEKENSCCVCYNDFKGYKTGFSCSKCGNLLCNECALKCDIPHLKLMCPTCKSILVTGEEKDIKQLLNNNKADQKIACGLTPNILNKFILIKKESENISPYCPSLDHTMGYPELSNKIQLERYIKALSIYDSTKVNTDAEVKYMMNSCYNRILKNASQFMDKEFYNILLSKLDKNKQ